MTKLVNLTPHAVTFLVDGMNPVVVPPSGTVARLKTSTAVIGSIDGIPITTTVFGDVTDLPDPTAGTVFIVSSLVAQAVRDRSDVFIPNDSVRDDAGRIVGCRSLGRI